MMKTALPYYVTGFQELMNGFPCLYGAIEGELATIVSGIDTIESGLILTYAPAEGLSNVSEQTNNAVDTFLEKLLIASFYNNKSGKTPDNCIAIDKDAGRAIGTEPKHLHQLFVMYNSVYIAPETSIKDDFKIAVWSIMKKCEKTLGEPLPKI